MRNKLQMFIIFLYFWLHNETKYIYTNLVNFSSFYFFLTSGDWKTFKITSFSKKIFFNFSFWQNFARKKIKNAIV
jgi:hypothetical protein